jgi:hypothetical protein
MKPGVDSDSGCRLVQGRLPTMLDGDVYHLGKSVDLSRGTQHETRIVYESKGLYGHPGCPDGGLDIRGKGGE